MGQFSSSVDIEDGDGRLASIRNAHVRDWERQVFGLRVELAQHVPIRRQPVGRGGQVDEDADAGPQQGMQLCCGRFLVEISGVFARKEFAGDDPVGVMDGCVCHG